MLSFFSYKLAVAGAMTKIFNVPAIYYYFAKEKP